MNLVSHNGHVRRQRLLAAVPLWVLVSAPSLLAQDQDAKRPITIVAFGDSTSAPRLVSGKGLAIYPQVLKTTLEARGMRVRLVNSSVPGSHSGRSSDSERHKIQHARDRFQKGVRDKRPGVVIIQFGMNDAFVDYDKDPGLRKSRIPLKAFRSNLTHIIRTLKTDGALVILMTPNMMGTRYASWRLDRLAKYCKVVRTLARSEKVALVDVWKLYEKYQAKKGQSVDDLLLDGAHPNARGHELVAGQLVERIEAWVRGGALGKGAARMPPGYTIPLKDLASDKHRQVIVDREKGQYLGHVTTVLLEDNKTMIVVYPKGHGRGAIVMKRSTDAGLTWSERLPTPESWQTSKEVPTIHRVIDKQGKKRLILFSGLYPIRMAVSEDDGESWSELVPIGKFGGIVTMGSVTRLASGDYMALFHDDGRFFQEDGKRQKPTVMTLYQTVSKDGGLSWSFPRAIHKSVEVHLCEPGVVRSPDGKQLAILLRENRRRRNSHVMFSNDEGESWTSPRELPAALTGDRHIGKYGPDGRLFLTFRDTTLESPTKGDWVGWVGRYEDIQQGREGQYRVRLLDNHHRWDCAYPGLEVLPDGTFVATTYGHWTKGESPYIVSARLTLSELDG